MNASMPDSHQSIAAYIERLLTIKDQLQEADLKSLALDVGLTEEDWAMMQEELTDHLTRAHAFLEHENWQDSLAEYEKALGINPIHQEALEGAARAHQLAWSKTQDRDHLDQATAHARKLLQYNPAHAYSIKLISDAQEARKKATAHIPEKPTSPGSPKKGVRLLLIGLTLMLGLVTTIVLLEDARPPGALAIPKPPNPPAVPASPQVPQTGEYQLYKKYSPEIRFYPNEHAEGLTFVPREVTPRKAEDAYHLRLKGFFNVSDRAFSKVDLQVEAFDKHDHPLFSSIRTVLRDHQPTHLPGDAMPFSVYINHKEPLQEEVAYCKVSVLKSLSSPSQGLDKPSPYVNFTWQGSPPPGVELTLSQRLRKITPNLKKGAYDKLVWELHNTGKLPIQQLVFRIDWMDKSGKVVSEKNLHFVTSSLPPIEPGQTRVNGGTYGIPDLQPEEVELYQITITQVDY